MSVAPHPKGGFLPLEDYGLIGNRHTAALVNSAGSIDWLCWPRFDSPSIFAGILDPDRGGDWIIRPTCTFTSRHRYLKDTNILQTIFECSPGKAALLDFMDMTWAEQDMEGGPPGKLIRIVRGLEGNVEMTSVCRPRPNYARDAPAITLNGNEADIGPFVITGPQGWLKDGSDMSLSQTFVVRPGEQFFFTLAGDRDKSPLASISAAMQSTLSYWRTWAGKCTYRGPYRDMVIRSALVLQLMTYAPSGAIVAAPTTSLPEEVGGERNWDYRFTWVRDGSLTLFALLLTGYHDFGESYAGWIYNTVNPDDVKILYPITPEGQTTEEILDHLSGYRNSRPVRIGNGAADQLQLDVIGEAMGAARFAWRAGLWKPPGEGRRIRMMLDWLIERRHEPDSGIWEVRGGLRHFVYGKAMIWYALDAAIEIFEGLNLKGDLERWREERDAIREEIMTRGWSTRLSAFKQSYEDDLLDAANLMLPIIGFIDGRDPRMLSTLDATMKDLVVDGLCYRYIDAPEGLRGKEATFILCTFWLVSALVLAGRTEEAREIYENLLSKASPLGLFAEEIDPVTGEQIGNFPQAFSHIGVIHAAVTLAYFAGVGNVDLEDWEAAARKHRARGQRSDQTREHVVRASK
ncbi:glycoside hydrolase family 15 protein [Methanoculleus sp. FWC-SCC1]|uniref:Glycoside hydrolase family 15 protein n=1 Tax=Methanoculleus frigidifontis TaxID=2584085 RepID=A0ABT8MDK9_9EURY|nr:glycoside hydrolase family 15 protein [Methanoculleus sp. FWC-SCC1]